MKKIYLARDLAQAQLIANMLEQHLIPAHIENIHQAGGLGELAVSYPQVWIKREQDMTRAKAVIEQFETSAAAKEDQVCAQCGEKNPSSFDWCWSCEADL